MIQSIEAKINPIVEEHVKALEEFTQCFSDYAGFISNPDYLTDHPEEAFNYFQEIVERVDTVSNELKRTTTVLLIDNTEITVKGTPKQ